MEMGVYFQAQDDYLDCFATPEVLGKVGTDIADKKCGWLFTKAYHELASPEQREFLDKHYGKCKVGSAEEIKIKELYKELGTCSKCMRNMNKRRMTKSWHSNTVRQERHWKQLECRGKSLKRFSKRYTSDPSNQSGLIYG